MKYPRIEILAHDPWGCQILFVESAGSVGINIASVVQAVEWVHQAGELPVVKLTIPCPVLEGATEAVKAAVSKIEMPNPTGHPLVELDRHLRRMGGDQ